jgi:Cys-rich four helix bundle protein (predicted Tat secretion target)
MNRRELVRVAVGTTVAHGLVTVLSCAAQTAAQDPAAPAHGGHGNPPSTGASEALLQVATKASHCVVVGEACLEHCIRLLSSGDTMLAGCAKQVQQMLAVCRSMSSLAAMGSEYAGEMAALCKKACEACASECEKHAGHHAECKACFEACRDTVNSIVALG